MARRAAESDDHSGAEHNEHHRAHADYWVGRLAPKQGLGTVYVIKGREEKVRSAALAIIGHQTATSL